MDLTIKINLDNAAFENDFTPELERIFDDLNARLPYLTTQANWLIIRDINGNNVGELTLSK